MSGRPESRDLSREERRRQRRVEREARQTRAREAVADATGLTVEAARETLDQVLDAYAHVRLLVSLCFLKGPTAQRVSCRPPRFAIVLEQENDYRMPTTIRCLRIRNCLGPSQKVVAS